MTRTKSKEPRRPRNPVLDKLAESFSVFRDCQPLALGVHKAIKARLPDFPMQELRVAMRLHTTSTRYLKVLSAAATRFDLDGLPAGDVTAEQRQQALQALRERFQKQAERLRAEQASRDKQADRVREEQAAREKQAKLNMLVEKFNSR